MKNFLPIFILMAHWFLYFQVLSLLHNSITTSTNLSTTILHNQAEERRALCDFYLSTLSSANYNVLDSWDCSNAVVNNSHANEDARGPCNGQHAWKNVTCENVLGAGENASYVTSIKLEFIQLNGTLPASFGNLSYLTFLSLCATGLRGTLPTELSKLTRLVHLDLGPNSLHGSFPIEYAMLKALTFLDLGNNTLTGNISDSLYQGLPSLVQLSIGPNRLSGTISSHIGALTKLSYLWLSGNRLEGRIPETVGNLSFLTSLGLSNNILSGPIPDLGNLRHLVTLVMQTNHLTNTVPLSVWSLTSLSRLLLYDNRLNGTLAHITGLVSIKKLKLFGNEFTGHLPADIFKLERLEELRLDSNRLTGPLTANLSTLSNYNASCLKTLFLGNNSFTGPITEAIFNLTGLQMLALGDNKLTSTLSPRIGQLTNLQYLVLSSNSLHGSLTPRLSLLSSLKMLDVRHNFLTSTLPAALGKLTRLLALKISGNSFRGSLPHELKALTDLVLISAGSNMFTGSITVSLTSLKKLEQLYIYDNRMTGSVDILFSDENFPSLRFLDISENRFGGSLAIKTVPQNLTLLAAHLNCFSGAVILDGLCSARQLKTLILDGLSSQEVCRKPIYTYGQQFVLNRVLQRAVPATVSAGRRAYSYMTNNLRGDLPGCIFALPNITTIHMSGNGLTGSLESGTWSLSLRFLSLSYNTLTGPFARELQALAAQMEELDLQNNCLNGFIESMTVSNSVDWTLKLRVNRLSGWLPKALTNAPGQIAVLDGNLFDCTSPFLHGDNGLPRSDPTARTYSCSSQQINQIMDSFAALVLTALIYLLVQGIVFNKFVHLRQLVTTKLFHSGKKNRDDLETSAANLHITKFVRVLSDVRAVTMFLFVFSVVVLMPIYPTLKVVNGGSYSVYKTDYLWIVSGIDLTGVPPAAVLIVVWSIVLVLTLGCIFNLFKPVRASVEAALQRQLEEINAEALLREQQKRLGSLIPDNHVDLRSLTPGRPISLIRTPHVDAFTSSKERDSEMSEVPRRVLRRALAFVLSPTSLALYIRARLFLRLLIITTIVCFASLTINIAYVSLLFYRHLTHVEQEVLQLSMATFRQARKGLSAFLFEWRPLMLGVHRVHLNNAPAFLRGGDSTELIFIVFDTLIAPCFATALCDNSCFFQAITGSDDVNLFFSRVFLQLAVSENSSNTFSNNDNAQHSNVLSIGTLLSTTYSYTLETYRYELNYEPPFIYHYQCSSSLIRVYAPVLVYDAILSAFLLPVFAFLVRSALGYFFPQQPEKDEIHAFPTSSPVSSPITSQDQNCAETETTNSVDQLDERTSVMHCLLICLLPPISRTPKELRLTRNPPGPLRHLGLILGTKVKLIDVNDLLLRTTHSFILFLTFGTICPLLGLAFLFDIAVTCTHWQYLIHTFNERWKHTAADKEALNAACAFAWNQRKHIAYRMRWFLLMLPSLFFSLFIFDIAGDALGWQRGIFAPAVMLVAPAAIFIILQRLFPNTFAMHAQSVRRGDIIPAAGNIINRVRVATMRRHAVSLSNLASDFSGPSQPNSLPQSLHEDLRAHSLVKDTHNIEPSLRRLSPGIHSVRPQEIELVDKIPLETLPLPLPLPLPFVPACPQVP